MGNLDPKAPLETVGWMVNRAREAGLVPQGQQENLEDGGYPVRLVIKASLEFRVLLG